jgi:hypothetical protein
MGWVLGEVAALIFKMVFPIQIGGTIHSAVTLSATQEDVGVVLNRDSMEPTRSAC